LVGGKTEKKTEKKNLIFLNVFPIDQSEAELQIISRNSRHDLLSLLKCHIDIDICISHLHGPAQKRTQKKTIKKTKLNVQFFTLIYFLEIQRDVSQLYDPIGK
jgi:hypothetical protein